MLVKVNYQNKYHTLWKSLDNWTEMGEGEKKKKEKKQPQGIIPKIA